MARFCIDCGKPIDYRGNRAIRCKECQAIYRRYMMKKLGSARASKELYQLYKLYLTLTPNDLQALYTTTIMKLKRASNYSYRRFLRTKLKLISNAYQEVSYGNTETT